jgi:hypothetical protein
VLVPGRTQPVWTFANKTAAMDNSSDEDIGSIVIVNNEFYYKHLIEEWSDSDSNNDSDLMLALTNILHEA